MHTCEIVTKKQEKNVQDRAKRSLSNSGLFRVHDYLIMLSDLSGVSLQKFYVKDFIIYDHVPVLFSFA